VPARSGVTVVAEEESAKIRIAAVQAVATKKVTKKIREIDGKRAEAPLEVEVGLEAAHEHRKEAGAGVGGVAAAAAAGGKRRRWHPTP